MTKAALHEYLVKHVLDFSMNSRPPARAGWT
jgi:hypothetical protein